MFTTLDTHRNSGSSAASGFAFKYALKAMTTRVARCVLVQHTKMVKIYHSVSKYTQWTYNIPTCSIPRPSKIYPNWDFWYANIPSGNPDDYRSRKTASRSIKQKPSAEGRRLQRVGIFKKPVPQFEKFFSDCKSKLTFKIEADWTLL
jgi:hypothetical protein